MPLARKGPFAPGEKIPIATWIEIERDCVAGMTVPEAAAKWGMKENTIRVKAKRDGWVMPSRVRHVLRTHDITAVKTEVARVTQDLAQRGERHREKIMDIAEQSLKTVKKVKVRNAKDFEIVDRAARRAAGLDSGDDGKIGVLIQLNERMENFEEEQPIEKDAVVREVEAEVSPIEPSASQPELSPEPTHPPT